MFAAITLVGLRWRPLRIHTLSHVIGDVLHLVKSPHISTNLTRQRLGRYNVCCERDEAQTGQTPLFAPASAEHDRTAPIGSDLKEFVIEVWRNPTGPLSRNVYVGSAVGLLADATPLFKLVSWILPLAKRTEPGSSTAPARLTLILLCTHTRAAFFGASAVYTARCAAASRRLRRSLAKFCKHASCTLIALMLRAT